LAGWAARDGFAVQFTGIDPDERAIAFAHRQTNAENITFYPLHTDDLTERFDVVLSNHVLHHLTAAEIPSFCACCERLAIRRVVHNDIHRHDLAYALFPLTGLLFHRSFIVEDGLRSIRRSFTAEELRAMIPPGWQVTTAFPFRLRLEWVTAS
jgi:2-polyprenyl-3-methyl-5-hydroxy-6-metoxy-1,4-benzoquinol methylase